MLLKLTTNQMSLLFKNKTPQYDKAWDYKYDSLWLDLLKSSGEASDKLISALTLNSSITLPEYVQDQIAKYLHD
jgi:hypothetical protein